MGAGWAVNASNAHFTGLSSDELACKRGELRVGLCTAPGAGPFITAFTRDSLDDAPAACVLPNSVTQDCSCPAGFTEFQFTAPTPFQPGSLSVVKRFVSFCLPPATSVYWKSVSAEYGVSSTVELRRRVARPTCVHPLGTNFSCDCPSGAERIDLAAAMFIMANATEALPGTLTFCGAEPIVQPRAPISPSVRAVTVVATVIGGVGGSSVAVMQAAALMMSLCGNDTSSRGLVTFAEIEFAGEAAGWLFTIVLAVAVVTLHLLVVVAWAAVRTVHARTVCDYEAHIDEPQQTQSESFRRTFSVQCYASAVQLRYPHYSFFLLQLVFAGFVAETARLLASKQIKYIAVGGVGTLLCVGYIMFVVYVCHTRLGELPALELAQRQRLEIQRRVRKMLRCDEDLAELARLEQELLAERSGAAAAALAASAVVSSSSLSSGSLPQHTPVRSHAGGAAAAAYRLLDSGVHDAGDDDNSTAGEAAAGRPGLDAGGFERGLPHVVSTSSCSDAASSRSRSDSGSQSDHDDDQGGQPRRATVGTRARRQRRHASDSSNGSRSSSSSHGSRGDSAASSWSSRSRNTSSSSRTHSSATCVSIVVRSWSDVDEGDSPAVRDGAASAATGAAVIVSDSGEFAAAAGSAVDVEQHHQRAATKPLPSPARLLKRYANTWRPPHFVVFTADCGFVGLPLWSRALLPCGWWTDRRNFNRNWAALYAMYTPAGAKWAPAATLIFLLVVGIISAIPGCTVPLMLLGAVHIAFAGMFLWYRPARIALDNYLVVLQYVAGALLAFGRGAGIDDDGAFFTSLIVIVIVSIVHGAVQFALEEFLLVDREIVRFLRPAEGDDDFDSDVDAELDDDEEANGDSKEVPALKRNPLYPDGPDCHTPPLPQTAAAGRKYVVVQRDLSSPDDAREAPTSVAQMTAATPTAPAAVLRALPASSSSAPKAVAATPSSSHYAAVAVSGAHAVDDDGGDDPYGGDSWQQWRPVRDGDTSQRRARPATPPEAPVAPSRRPAATTRDSSETLSEQRAVARPATPPRPVEQHPFGAGGDSIDSDDDSRNGAARGVVRRVLELSSLPRRGAASLSPTAKRDLYFSSLNF